jgi:hypothetical protein
MWVKHNGMSKVIMISDQDGKLTLGVLDSSYEKWLELS